MANAVQTVMSNAAEAFLLREDGEGTVTFQCSGGGTLSYSGSFDDVDLDADSGSASFPVVFDNCIIKVCGDSITFATGGTATLVIAALSDSQVGNLVGGGAIIGADEDFFELELIIADKPVTGIVEGNIGFAYKMRIIGSVNGLSEIQIIESSSGDPLSLPSGPLPASTLSTLAERC